MAKVQPKIERNLTTKTLGLDPKALVEAAVKKLGAEPTKEALEAIRVPLAVMFGIITGTKPMIDSKTGEVRSAILGTFEGRTADGKTIVQAPRLYIPQVQETLESDFNSLPANVRGQRMKFQANIFATYFDDQYGFRYSVDLPLRDTSSDPLGDMREGLIGFDGEVDKKA